MKTLDRVLINQIVQRLVSEFNPEQIILFGLHAWGTPNEDSDIDLCVIVQDSKEPPRMRHLRGRKALTGISVPFDLIVKTRTEMERYQSVYASLECQILDEGIVLYDKFEEAFLSRLPEEEVHP
jgi:predicted nucleotidyltransferase